MKIITFDIETLPAPPETESLIKELYAKMTERNISYEEYFRKTSLNGNFGRIFCIGYALDDEPASVLTGDEKEILNQFWQIVVDRDRFIGHYIIEFDLPFIIKRSRALQIKPTRQFPWAQIRAGLASELIFDTKREWECWAGGSGSGLDTLAKILGFETSKQGIDGSQVYDFWLAGRHKEIEDYCRRDVELTRQIYSRLEDK